MGLTKKEEMNVPSGFYTRARALNNCCYTTTYTSLVETISSIIRAF